MKFFIGFLLVFLMLACEDENSCGVTEYSDEVYISFYNLETKASRTVLFDSMKVSYPSGELFYFIDTVGASGYILPLDMTSSFTDFNFITESEDYDFRLNYKKQLLIENESCGPVFRVFALEASSVEFDSVVVKVIELTKNISPHVEVYF